MYSQRCTYREFYSEEFKEIITIKLLYVPYFKRRQTNRDEPEKYYKLCHPTNIPSQQFR